MGTGLGGWLAHGAIANENADAQFPCFRISSPAPGRHQWRGQIHHPTVAPVSYTHLTLPTICSV
eukprot:97724-Rhodomonas_salina.6